MRTGPMTPGSAGRGCVRATHAGRARRRAWQRVGGVPWVVERTLAWLHQFRRLRVRYERRDDVHEAFRHRVFPHLRRLSSFCLKRRELARRPVRQRSFQTLPRQRVVERAFGWLNLRRRLSKDGEALRETTETWIYISMTGLMPRRLAHLPPVLDTL